MIVNGLKTGRRELVYGNRSDVCWFCAEERAAQNREEKKRTGISREAAAQELKGKFATKPMFRFPISGGPYMICLEHMKQFTAEMEEIANRGKLDEN